MKLFFRVTMIYLLLPGIFISACGPVQLFAPTQTFTPTSTRPPSLTFAPEPTLTPTRTATPRPTLTVTPEPTPTLPPSISAIPMNCKDQAGVVNGDFRAENNTWGKGTLKDWSQCIGLGKGPGATMVGRWTWDWPKSGINVKAYPEVIFGQKPGSSTTSLDLPKKIRSVDKLIISYDITSTHTGSGNIAFDIWLTNTQNPSKFGVPPITHEIMIWLDGYGGMQPGGNYLDQVKIDDTLYNVYTGDPWGDGWKYIAFARDTFQTGPGTLNLASFLSYIRTRKLATGDEYIASVELGNEVVSGVGETILHKYEIKLH